MPHPAGQVGLFRYQNHKEPSPGTSLEVQWLRLRLPMQGVQVRSLVGELRSHVPHSQKTKTKQKQYCNKFNKDFKNGPHQKKKNLKQKKRRSHLQIQSVVGIIHGQVPGSLQTGQPTAGAAVRPSPPASGSVTEVSASSYRSPPELGGSVTPGFTLVSLVSRGKMDCLLFVLNPTPDSSFKAPLTSNIRFLKL